MQLEIFVNYSSDKRPSKQWRTEKQKNNKQQKNAWKQHTKWINQQVVCVFSVSFCVLCAPLLGIRVYGSRAFAEDRLFKYTCIYIYVYSHALQRHCSADQAEMATANKTNIPGVWLRLTFSFIIFNKNMNEIDVVECVLFFFSSCLPFVSIIFDRPIWIALRGCGLTTVWRTAYACSCTIELLVSARTYVRMTVFCFYRGWQ